MLGVMSLHPRTVHLCLERVRRHYEACILSCDEVSLLELAHALRNWVDMAPHLATCFPSFSIASVFETRAPTSGLTKLARGGKFTVAYFPGGVSTRAIDGILAHFPNPDPTAIGGVQALKGSDGSIDVYVFYWIPTDDFPPIQAALQSAPLKRFAFREWLGAEAVRVAYPGADGLLETKTLDRSTLIRRVANTLGGSHPPGTSDDLEQNSFDAALNYLLQFWINGATLPYFALLKVAREILDRAPALMGKVGQ